MTINEVPRRFDLRMRAFAENVYLARALVDQAAESWCLPDGTRDSGRVVLTELVTNVVRLYEGVILHAWVANEAGRSVLELGVWDPDPLALPKILPLSDGGERGRGLALAYELTDQRLGWYRSETVGGKVVWARVGPTT